MSVRHRARATAITSIFVLFGSSSFTSMARAGDLEELEGLLDRPIVSSASHTNEDASTAPATSSILTSDDIRRHGIRSLDEAINFLSLGMMTSTPLRYGEMGTRGVLISGDFNNHVLLLIDGHATNELWYGSVPLDRGAGVPMELIDHVEIILGPGSVLYGSYAMLGVINVVTKRAKDFHGVHVIAESEVGKQRDGRLGGLVGVAGAEATSIKTAVGVGYEFKLFGRASEVTAQVEYYDQQGPAFKFGPQPDITDTSTGGPKNFGPRATPGVWGGVATQSYETRVPAGYVRWKVGDFEVALRGAMNERRTPYINYSNSFTTDFNEHRTRDRELWFSGDVRYTKRVSSAMTLMTRLYGDSYDYDAHKVTSSPGDCGGLVAGCDLDSLGSARWLGLEGRTTIEWWKDASFTTIAGLDGRRRSVTTRYETFDRSNGARTSDTSPHPDRNDLTLGAYLQQNARPFASLTASAGVRADIDQRYGKTASPRAAVAYTPWKDSTLKAIYASAFRIPSTYEATYSESPSQPARTLDPESVRSIEGSFEQRFGTHRLLVGVFRSWWSRLIVYQYDATSGLGGYENTGTIDNTGFNAAYEGSFVQQRLRVALNVTGAYSRQREPDVTSSALPAAPSFFGNARASYDLQGKLPTLAIAAHLRGPAYADQYRDGGFTPTPTTPSTLMLRATISGPMPAVRNLSYRLSVTGNTATHAPYVVGPTQVGTPTHPSADLAPVDQFRIGVGLQYDIDP